MCYTTEPSKTEGREMLIDLIIGQVTGLFILFAIYWLLSKFFYGERHRLHFFVTSIIFLFTLSAKGYIL